MLTFFRLLPDAPFNSKELYEVMDLCLSCKGCTSECPSNVDMSTLKAEFLHQYYQSNPIPLRTKAIANIGKINQLAAYLPRISNFFLGNTFTSKVIKNTLGIAPKRSLPLLYKTTLRSWFKKWKKSVTFLKEFPKKGEVYLFCDEFTNFNDVEIGIKTIQLLTKLGYGINMVEHPESGRAYLSKGLLKEVKYLAKTNVSIFKNIITENTPLIGIEPSAILSFRDEYPKLVSKEQKAAAQSLSKNCLLIDEFLNKEMDKGNISSDAFTLEKKHLLLHGHCHQKALASIAPTAFLLNLPKNYTVEVIPSGCCGMAGSFGYEKEHYEVSMQIGELVLFPAIRQNIDNQVDTIVVAAGTSCRHQILDGTKVKALHPVEILLKALKD